MTDELNKKPDEEVVESSEPSTTNPEVAAFVAGKLANQTPGDNPYADRAAAQDAVNRDAFIGHGGTPGVGKVSTSPEVAAFVAGKKAPAPSTTPTTGNEQQVTTPVADSTNAGAQQPGTDVGNNPFADRAAVQDAIAQQTSNPSTVQQPVVPTEEKPEVKDAPQYLTDWSKVGNVYEEAKKLNLPLAQVLQDYQRWGNETGNPTYWINAMFQDADLSKSVADNEEAKKMQERKERWDKVNNFLLHLGNAIGNVGGGGYASVKLEDPVQWSERQRLLKEKGLEQRRLNNQSLIQQMHKNWADERANRVQQQNYEMKQREMNLKENQQKHKEYMDSYKIKIAQQKFDYQKEKDKLDRELKERQISQRDYALRISALNASVNEYRAYNPLITTVEKTDSLGGKTIEKRTQSRGGNKGKGYGGSTSKGQGY